ncbi:MAG: DUF2849 domain-containing protein [Pseudomonadota bacterium]
MAKITKGAPKALSANRLKDGIVVFLTKGKSWSEDIQDVAIAKTPEEEQALLDTGASFAAINDIVDPYLFDVEQNGSEIKAAHIREHMRTKGPSVRKDLGKQAGT